MSYLSLSGLAQTYNTHKDAIHAQLAGTATPADNANFSNLFGFGLATMLVIIVAALALWGFAIYLLYTNWATLPDWARVVGVLGVLPLPIPIGPIGTIIVVLIAKGSRKN